MMVHPTPDKDLVFQGDKSGNLGVCDAMTPEADLDDDEDESKPVVRSSWTLNAHTRGTISCIRLSPMQSHVVSVNDT